MSRFQLPDGSLALAHRPPQFKRRVQILLDRRVEVELGGARRRTVLTAGVIPTLVVLLALPSLRPDVLAADNDQSQPRSTMTLPGRVLAEGKPSPRATVYLREAPASWSQAEVGRRPNPTRNIAQTTADAEGRFEFKKVSLPETGPRREHAFPLDVIGFAAGHGVAWQHLHAPPTQPLELSLPTERKVAGKLTKPDGRPAQGVRVRVREIADLAAPWRPSLESAGYLELESSDVPLHAVTVADGKFVLRGLPAGIRATVVVDDRRYLRRESCIATTDEQQPALTEWPTGRRGAQPTVLRVHSWYAQIEVERAYRILGRVVFADTGQPAVGAGCNDRQTSSPPVGVADDDGRFTLDGLPPGKFRLHVTPPADRPYLGVDSTLELTGENYEVEHTIELPRGELVHGRVVDAGNGRGIGGATIWYARKPGPRKDPQPLVNKVQSAPDGRFTIAVLPETAELIVAGSVRGYITHDRSGSVTSAPAEFHRPIDVRAGQAHAEVTFELQPKPNAALAAHVIDADGKPAEGIEITYQGFGEENGSAMSRPPVRTTSDGKGGFVLDDLDSSFQYDVRVLDRRRRLGSFLQLSQLARPKAPLTIQLEPLAAAAGRVVDEKQPPIAGTVVRLYARQGRSSSVDGEPVATDAEGRFELSALLPGIAYSVQTSVEGYASRHDEAFMLNAGETHALGNIVLPRADQDLSGVLVDAQGKPVAGARIVAYSNLADGHCHARTETRLTDNQGRFQLRGLPRGDATVWQSFDQFDNRKSLLGQAPAGTKDLRLVVANPQ
jgi:hypothetical protein